MFKNPSRRKSVEGAKGDYTVLRGDHAAESNGTKHKSNRCCACMLSKHTLNTSVI